MVEDANRKTEYVQCLMKFINLKLHREERYKAFHRMQEIEEEWRKEDKVVTITVSTEKL